MTFSPDGAPLIGRVPDAAGRVFVVAGLNGSGFMKGAMSGKLLAALIDGDARAAELLRSADPARFAVARQL
jgi:glycine/D-amino acid oxidase-like deaminating enzyme